METTIAVPGASLGVIREGTGPAILFIQGVGVAAQAWRPQLAALVGDYQCIAFDNRGVGRSRGDAGPTSIEALAADAVAVLDWAGVERAHVVGHSMGGVIAQQLALDHPARVRSLALVCTFSRGREAVRLRWDMLRRGLPTMIGPTTFRARAMARLIASPRDIDALGADGVARIVGDAFGRPLARRPAVAMHQLRALARHDAHQHLATLQGIPSLVLSGDDDIIAPARYGRTLATAIGAVRFSVVPEAGHALPILQPQVVNDALRTHFALSSRD